MNINKYAVVRKFICWIIKKKKYEELYERTVLNVLNNAMSMNALVGVI